MSRVTIGEITEDLLPFTEKGNKVITIEIVPRKIVEDIIKVCDVQMEIHERNANIAQENHNQTLAEYHLGQNHAFHTIHDVALLMLRDFEEGSNK